MTMTREQVAAVVAQYERYTTGKDGMTLSAETTVDLARQLLSAMDQLADADMAQAALVERAAAAGYRICAETRHVKLGQQVEAAVRALAPADGLAAVEAMRKERDEAKRLMQARHREMLAADDLMRKHQRRAEKAEAERDRLTDELAEARAERDALFRRATLAEEWRDHDKARVTELATELAEARKQAEADQTSLNAAEEQTDRLREALELCQRLGGETVQRIARNALAALPAPPSEEEA